MRAANRCGVWGETGPPRVLRAAPPVWRGRVVERVEPEERRALVGHARKPYSSLMKGRVTPELPKNGAPSTVVESFRATLDLFQTGVDVMRQTLRRGDPEASAEEIDRRLRAWLLERPGAASGDSPGRPVDVIARLA